MKFRAMSLWLAPIAWLLAWGLSGTAAADDLSSRSRLGQQSAAVDEKPLEATPGGAALADFGTLMNLIESTIDPDSWLAQGGSNAMLPYPAGVWIDPRGQLADRPVPIVDQRRLESLLNPGGQRSSDSSQSAWLAASPLRVISLRELDRRLLDISHRKLTLTPEIIQLAGLSRVQYVLVDAEHRDVVLAGPADGHQNGFFLEDLATVTSLIRGNTQAFGCSIEPVHDNLLATQEYIATPAAQKILSQNPEKFAKLLEQKMGNHTAQVFGMHPRSSTAVALLAADVSMKELGFGKSDLRLPIKDYFDFLERESAIPRQSLIRWWFDYSNQAIASNAEQTLFRLPANCVQLYSEQQFLTQHGRQASGQADPAADAFAAELNGRLDQLRTLDASYSRMCCVFESALALQVGLTSLELADYQAWFPTLFGLGQLEQPFVHQPQWVSSLVATHRAQTSRTNIAVVSGGVQVNPLPAASREHWQTSPHLSGSQVPSMAAARWQVEPQESRWWWD